MSSSEWDEKQREEEWRREQKEEDFNDFIGTHGDDILREAGRLPDADGNWSEEDIAFLEMIYRKGLDHPAIN
jgi:hypothetical protein